MEFVYSFQFKKQFKKLPKTIKLKMSEKLRLFIKDEFHPLLNNHQLTGEFADRRSINITGDTRLIYRRLDKNTCYLIAIGTHSQLYG